MEKNQSIFYLLLLLFSFQLNQVLSQSDPAPTPSSSSSSQVDSSDPGNDDGQTPDIEEILIGVDKKIKYVLNTTSDGSTTAYVSGFYKFKFEHKLPERDAFIMVKGREDFQHSPEMFFSSIDTNPSYYSSSSQQCGIMGVDICTIPAKYIMEGEYYYLGVYCYADCEFEIKIVYNEVYAIHVGEIMSVQFPKGEGSSLQEVKILLTNRTDITNIMIEAYVLNPSQVHEPFHMYVNQGNESPSSLSHDYYAEQIWFQGKGVHISQSDTYPPWKQETNYTVLVEAPAGAIIAVASQAWSSHRKLKLMKNLFDMVEFGEDAVYELTLTGSELSNGDSISFDLEPYYGNPNIYVNPDVKPSKREEYKWNSRETTGMESLTITNNDYDFKNKTEVKLYVLVHGEMTASYRLIAYRADVSIRYLVYDCTETGYVTGQDIVQYQLWTMTLSKTALTISATGLSGNVYLYVKVCAAGNLADCAITKEEISSKKSDAVFFAASQNSGSLHKIHYDYDPLECTKNTTNSTDNSTVVTQTDCITIVALANAILDDTNKNKTVSHYRLTAKHKNSHIILKENVPYRSWLRINDKEYFKFTIPDTDDAEDIERVDFLATAVAGEIDVFVSRLQRWPRSNDTEKSGFLSEDSLSFQNPTDFLGNETSLAGTYYVTVSGYTSATFDLSVKVVKKNGTGYCGAERRLYMGYVDFGNLDYLYPETYYFQYDKQDELFKGSADPLEAPKKLKIFIYFHQYNKTSKQKAANLFFWPAFSIYYKNGDKAIQNVDFSDVFYSMDFFQFTILIEREDTGKYMIVLNHTNPDYQDIRLKYFISVNHNNINNIVPEGGGYVAELMRNETDMFELFIPEESSFYLQVYECIGQVRLNASSSLKNIENGVFDVTTGQNLRDGGTEENLIEWEGLKDGPFYFSVSPQPIKDNEVMRQYQSFDGAIFMLIPHIIKKGEKTPHHYLYANGQMDYGIKKNSNYTIVITVPQLSCSNCDKMPYNVSYYSYTIHVTDSLELIDYFSKCNLGQRNIRFEKSGFKNYTERVQRHFATVFFDETGPVNDTISFEVTTRLIGKGPFYVSAMAVAYVNTKSKYDNQDPYSFMYEKLIMKLDDNPFTDDEEGGNVDETDLLMLFVIGGGAFVVIGIFVGIYCYKKKYGAVLEEYEMEKKQKQVGEEDDEDVADQYKKGADKFQMIS